MINAHILDGKGTNKKAHLHQENGHVGVIAFTDDLRKFSSKITPLVNVTFGTALNQDGSTGGTPEKIHNGGTSTEWGATAVAGTWNFADAGKTSLTSGSNLDEALFEDSGGGTVDMSSYSAVSGKIQLDTYNPANESIIFSMGLAGTPAGNTVNLNDYIDTGLIGSEQSFLIPKADLGLGTDTIDELTITLNKAGGPKPTFRFDDLQIEETGGGIEYCGEPDADTKFYVTQIIFSIADTGTGGTAFAYNQIGAIAALTNGVNLAIFEEGEVAFSITARQNSDLIGAGAALSTTMDDGTDTYYTLVVDLTTPRVLDSRESDKIVATVNDDLSGLLLFNIFIRGKEESLV